METRKEIMHIPADVPRGKRLTYRNNYLRMTHGSGNLFLFAGDQRVEHLHEDFSGKGIAPEDASPEHFFRIANKAKIGVFATQYGLIAKYGPSYKKIPYLVKLNSKTNLVPTKQKDPYSKQWLSIDQVLALKKSGLKILGVGYTIYLGSEYENEMLAEAAKIVHEAHKNGLLVVFWMYPRGKAVKDEKSPALIAGAAGVAACLGADFVKVNYPSGRFPARGLKEAVIAAGRTQLVCAGGGSMSVKKFLETLHTQIHAAGASGNATGRNIHQKELSEAIRFCNAIYAITVENKTVEEAMKVLKR